MMTEETNKKLYLWIIIGVGILGILFLVWAMFLNRGTLTVSGDAPFLMNIQGVRTENCSESPCSTVLAPGKYSITVQKAGYETMTLDVEVPIGGEATKEVAFRFIPVISKRGVEAELQLFTEPALEIPELEDTALFFEENYVAYLKHDPETKKQTLYVSGIVDGELADTKVGTSFIRTITDYTIVPSVEENSKVALIDTSDEEESTLYMIDLSEKTRNALVSFPFIHGVKWINGSDNFLLEAREQGEVTSSIYLFDAEKGEPEKMDLKTSVDNIAVISKDRIVAATSQTFIGTAPSEELGGELITLGEMVATPSVNMALPGPQLSFVDYSLLAHHARLIAIEPSLPGANKVKLETDKKSLLFLSNGEVYELQFEE